MLLYVVALLLLRSSAKFEIQIFPLALLNRAFQEC